MAGIQIHHISLTCRDPLAVERFYTRHFGFVRGRVVDLGGGNQIVFLRGPGIRLELFQATAERPVPPPENDGYPWPSVRNISFEVDDIDAHVRGNGRRRRASPSARSTSAAFIPGLAVGVVARSRGLPGPAHPGLRRPGEPAPPPHALAASAVRGAARARNRRQRDGRTRLMALLPVRFEYLTGLRRPYFSAARLSGSWDAQGHPAQVWARRRWRRSPPKTAVPAFRATVQLDDSQIGAVFRWGVSVDTARPREPVGGADRGRRSPARRGAIASSCLRAGGQTERYYLTDCRWLGANKLYLDGQDRAGGSLCGVGAERAQLSSSSAASARAATSTTTAAASPRPSRCTAATTASGRRTWPTDPALADFGRLPAHAVHVPHHQGRRRGRLPHATCSPAARSAAAGRSGSCPERRASWNGTREDLDGGKSCSVVVDPERVVIPFRQLDANGNAVWPETEWQTEDEFWADEFDPERPLPTRREDMVIYELHVDGLGARPRRAARHPRRRHASLAGQGRCPVPARARRQRRRADAAVGVPGRLGLGLQHDPLLRGRVRQRRAGPVQALRPRMPPQRHRRHSRRRLQPLRARGRSEPSGSSTRTPRSATSTTGTRAGPRTTLHATATRRPAMSTTARAAGRPATGRSASAGCSSPASPR